MATLGTVEQAPFTVAPVNGAPYTPAGVGAVPLKASAPAGPGGGAHDVELARAVRRTSFMRQCFYVVVLLVALAGQVSGAVEALHIPLIWAIFAVGGLELGGIVVLANADVRRRLGEHALASRLLSASIAAGAVAFNWIAHSNKLQGGFFAGMSALGYLVWLMHTENQRRDRLRAKGDLPPTTPAYEFFHHWLRHPLVTARAKSLAKANPTLGLYGSLAAAREQIAAERRAQAVAKVLKRQFRKSNDPSTADLIEASIDLGDVGARAVADLDPSLLAGLVATRIRALVAASSAGLNEADDDVDPEPVVKPHRAPTARTAKTNDTATRVAQALRRTPDATVEAIAKRLGKSVRTVRRHWPETQGDTP